MRNRAFSLQACNEVGVACDNHRWPCCKSFHGNAGRHLRRAFASTQTTTGQAIEPGLPRPDRPNAKTPAYKTSAHKTPARMITPAGGLYRRNAPSR
jgi:hypothetical protein